MFIQLFALIKNKIMEISNPIQYSRKIGVSVGEDCRFISMPDFGSEPYLIEIGNHVTVSADVAMITHDGGTWCVRDKEKYKGIFKYGKIIIKDNCFIGMRSIIMPGVTIGANSIVAAGAIVTKDVPENSVVAGIPAKVIKNTMEYAEEILNNMPKYNLDNYKINKKEELLRILK